MVQMGHPEAAAALLAAGASVTLGAVNGAVVAGKPVCWGNFTCLAPAWIEGSTASRAVWRLLVCTLAGLFLRPLAGSHQLLEALLQRGHPEVPRCQRELNGERSEEPIWLSYEG